MVAAADVEEDAAEDAVPTGTSALLAEEEGSVAPQAAPQGLAEGDTEAAVVDSAAEGPPMEEAQEEEEEVGGKRLAANTMLSRSSAVASRSLSFLIFLFPNPKPHKKRLLIGRLHLSSFLQ